MIMKLTLLLLLTVGLTACAHRGATRVDCTGALRPINLPSQDARPVSVAPASVDPDASGVPQS